MIYAKLRGQNLSMSGKTLTLDRTTNLIGRGKDASLVILEPSVSRMHAKITIDDKNRFKFEDLNSSNGCFVNDERLTEARYLKDGDRIKFGSVEFIFEISDELKRMVPVEEERLVPPKMQRQVDEFQMVAPQPQQQEEAYEEEEVVEELNIVPIVIIGVIGLAVIGLLVYFIFLRKTDASHLWVGTFGKWEKVFDSAAGQMKETYFDEEMAKIQKNIKDGKIEDATVSIKGLKIAFRNDPESLSRIESLEKQVSEELKYKSIINEAVDMINKSEKYEEGIEKLKSIPKTSIFYKDAQTELDNLKSIKDDIKSVALKYYKTNFYKEAYKYFKGVAAIDPTDADAKKYISILQSKIK